MNHADHLKLLRTKFEHQEPAMEFRNDNHYWISFSMWLVENHHIVAKIKL